MESEARAVVKYISLDELPAFSPWTKRILAGDVPGVVQRTSGYVQREYDQKYGQLRWARTMYEARKIELGLNRDREVAMCHDEELGVATLSEAMEESVNVLLREVVLRKPRAVIDLGCGYGYFLWRLRKLLGDEPVLIGGDGSGVGIATAERLSLRPRTSFYPLSFEGTRHPVFEDSYGEERALVATSYALHQLPSAAPVLDVLGYYRDRIETVVSFEPEEDLFGDGLLGRLRRLYGRTNGYSADLLRCLNKRDDVEIQTVYPNIIGANALLPATLSIWRFK